MPPPTRRTTARRGLLPSLALAVLLVLAACGGPAPTERAPQGVAPGFPVTVDHALGRTEIPTKPQRVLAIGSGDVQMARALGAEVVGTTRNPSSPDGNWPGVVPPLPAEVMVANLTEPNLEQIAALDPDLILITSAQPGWAAIYPQLAAIAPTLPHLRTPLGDDGGELLDMIGRAVGNPEGARAIAAASDERIARFRAAHPNVEGRTVAFGQYVSGTTQLVVTPDATSTRFFGRLGLRLPDAFGPVAANGPTQLGLARFSGEQLSVLDSADLAFVSAYGPGAGEEFGRQPIVAATRVERTGNLHRISVDLAGAMLTPNPASTGYVLDSLDPLVARSTL